MPQFNELENNANMHKPHHYVGLDIGSSKICCLVASYGSSTETLNVLGVGFADSDGIKNGVIVNVDKATAKIKEAVSQAEQQSGLAIKNVTVGISGDHIESEIIQGVVGISNPTKEVKLDDINRLLNETRSMANYPDRTILDLIPQDFMIDNQVRTTDPVGMTGLRLQGNVLVISSLNTPYMNLKRCLERSGLIANQIIAQPLAASKPVITHEEKEMGVAVLDIGGGTTEISVYHDSIIKFTSVIGISGKNITEDIAHVLQIQNKVAEQIKKEHGLASENSLMHDEIISIPGINGRSPSEATRKYLAKIIQARLEEIFEFSAAEINVSGVMNDLRAGIVLTGGISNLPNIEEVAYSIFNMPIKIGMPENIKIDGLVQEVNNPIYTSVVGLTMIDIEYYQNNNVVIEKSESQEPTQIVEEAKQEVVTETPKEKVNPLKSFWGKTIETLKEL